jgi:hypothetical protein
MKISWGTGIFIFIIAFILAILGFLYFAMHQNTDLVEEDYYPKELVYQKQIDRINNAKALEQDVVYELKTDQIVLRFPILDSTTMPSGSLHLYRPSDEKLDKKGELQLTPDYTQTIGIEGFPAGKYLLKILWEWNGTEYYKEETIILP